MWLATPSVTNGGPLHYLETTLRRPGNTPRRGRGSHMLRPLTNLALVGVALCGLGCSGSIGDGGGFGPGGPSDPWRPRARWPRSRRLRPSGGRTRAPCRRTRTPSPGTAPLRRLTRLEYENTVRDLLGSDRRAQGQHRGVQRRSGVGRLRLPARRLGHRRPRRPRAACWPPRSCRPRPLQAGRPRCCPARRCRPARAGAGRLRRQVHRRLRAPRLPPPADRRRGRRTCAALYRAQRAPDAGADLPAGHRQRHHGDAAVALLPLPMGARARASPSRTAS